MLPFGDLAYRPVVTSYQSTIAPCSDSEKFSNHQCSKNNHELLPPSIPHPAATAYLSDYDSALLRCHDAAGAELKDLLWPLVANKMKAALDTLDELNPDDLENLHSRPVSDIRRKSNGAEMGRLHPRNIKPLKRRAENAANDAQLELKKLRPGGLSARKPVLLTPTPEKKIENIPNPKKRDKMKQLLSVSYPSTPTEGFNALVSAGWSFDRAVVFLLMRKRLKSNSDKRANSQTPSTIVEIGEY